MYHTIFAHWTYNPKLPFRVVISILFTATHVFVILFNSSSFLTDTVSWGEKEGEPIPLDLKPPSLGSFPAECVRSKILSTARPILIMHLNTSFIQSFILVWKWQKVHVAFHL